MIKERHGFNKETLGLFFKDQVKSILLIVILGTPIFVLFMKLIDWGGDLFFIYLFIACFILLLMFIHIVPNYIMPLFNTYKDLDDGTLKTKI